MYPPTDTPIDPLGLPPAPAAPALPQPAQPKSMNPIAKSVLVALAAMAGPGRGTGILQGLSLADQQAQARAQQQNALAVQDYTRQHQAYQDEQRTYQQQQTQRAAMLKNVLDSFQMELGNTTSDAEAENLYQSAGQLLSAQGFRGFDADSLKRKYKSPDMALRANKAIAKWMANPINKQAFENDPEGIGRITIDVGGAPMTIAQAQAMTGGAAPTAKPKTATPRQPAAVGSFEDYLARTFGENPTSAQILQARKDYNTADNAPTAARQPAAVGSFEDFVARTYGKNPTSQQILDARKQYNTADNVPKPGADMSPGARALADDYYRESKDFITRAQSYNTIRTVGTSKTPTPGGDISLVFAYMKMLDPGSTVREGEQATARNAVGIPDWVRNLYNNAVRGTSLTPSQRADFVGRAKDIYLSAKRMQDATTRTYTERATIIGTDPRLVIRDFGAGVDDAVLPVGQSESDQRRKEIEAKIANLNQQRQGQK